jgi:hypothetical protein
LDACFRFRQIPVFVAMHFFILQRFHERFAGRVTPWIRTSIKKWRP